MKKIRPVNLSLTTIYFPIPAIVSILHRIAGILLFLSLPALLWGLHLSLATREGFDKIVHFFSIFWVKSFFWVFMVVLVGHTFAGIRHLLMDINIGESLRAGRISAWIVIILTLLFALIAGVWLW